MAIRILTTSLAQVAVYWGSPKSDGEGGTLPAVMPVQLKVRWVDEAVEFMSPTGDQLVSKSVVSVESLDGGVGEGASVELGGFLKLASLASLGTKTDLSDNRDADEIRGFSKLPTLKADEFLRKAML